VQAQEVIVWAETISKVLEHEVLPVYSLLALDNDADACVFIRKNDKLSIIAIYVDDLILITKTPEEMQQIKPSGCLCNIAGAPRFVYQTLKLNFMN